METVLIYIITFVAGIIVGGVLYHFMQPGQAKSKELKSELDELRDEHISLQEKVSDHFSKTSELINKLSDDYTAIQKHLSTGAEEFANSSNALESAVAALSLESSSDSKKGGTLPPKDYAPKSDADVGTLSEHFGIDK